MTSMKNRWFLPVMAVVFAVVWLAPDRIHAAVTNQATSDVLQQVLDRLQKDEEEIKALKAELANRPPAAVPATNPAAPAPDPQLQQRVEKDEAALASLQSQVNATESAALKP